jgi:hypothetical protein
LLGAAMRVKAVKESHDREQVVAKDKRRPSPADAGGMR